MNASGAIFLDRDGTIIEDNGHLGDPAQVVFYPETFDVLAKLQRSYKLFIVTNQSGISKGIVTAQQVSRVNDYVLQRLARHGIKIAEVYVCPHARVDNCKCIKPKPYFLHKARQSHNIDLACSYTIGDHPHDVSFAQAVGAKGIYLLTGHGPKHLGQLSDHCPIASGIAQVPSLLTGSGNGRLDSAKMAEIQKAAAAINKGRLVVFPTETVYGLGADAFSQEAVINIFKAKKRPANNPLIVHIAGLDQLYRLVKDFPEKAKALASRFWPGPLTMVFEKKSQVPDAVTASLPTVAVRVPDHPVALALIRQAQTPIAAPSANYFGQVSPTCSKHIGRLGQSVDMVLDGGPCQVGLESTIISFAQPKPRILRFGGITVEQIQQVIGPVETDAGSDEQPLCPGRLAKHYSPKTPLKICDGDPDRIEPGKKTALLCADKSLAHEHFAAVEILSPAGDLDQAAAQLYAAMRRLDALQLDQIFAVCVEDSGIGRAINDRLRRASHQ